MIIIMFLRAYGDGNVVPVLCIMIIMFLRMHKDGGNVPGRPMRCGQHTGRCNETAAAASSKKIEITYSVLYIIR